MENNIPSPANHKSKQVSPLWLDCFLAIILMLSGLPVVSYAMDSIRTRGLLHFAMETGFGPGLAVLWAMVYFPCKVATTKRRMVLWLLPAILFVVIYFGCPVMDH
jgi:hypothetical protein